MSRTRPNPVIEHLRVLRIDHWLKNIFIVFGHLVAAALLALPPSWELARVAFLSLIPACLIASANYILNEILDAPFDRLHPSKNIRPIPAGTVSVPLLWGIMGGLIVVGFALSVWWFNPAYTISLAALLVSGLVYNIPPLRLKDRAYADVIAESFNNPVRLWLGWYALAPATTFPPLSIVLAWWCFGGLLMTGKRYAEYRFIGDAKRSGNYRASFRVYDEKRLVIAMITYANLFCFCMGAAITTYRPNLVFVFPIVVVAIIVYFHHAMTSEGAKLEPEQLLKNPGIILCTVATVGISIWLAWTDTDVVRMFRLLEPIGYELKIGPP